jgi:hypothetical protein
MFHVNWSENANHATIKILNIFMLPNVECRIDKNCAYKLRMLYIIKVSLKTKWQRAVVNSMAILFTVQLREHKDLHVHTRRQD